MPALFYAILVLLAGTSYGFGSIILKVAFAHGISVQDMTNAQYTFGWVLNLPFLIIQGIRARKSSKYSLRRGIDKRQIWLLIGIGLAGAATSYFYYRALTALNASLGIVLLFQFAWMVVVMDAIVKRRVPTVEKWIGLVFIVVGTLFAVGIAALRGESLPLWAVFFGLIAALGYSFVLYLSEFTNPDISPWMRSEITVTTSLIVISFVFPPTYLFTGAFGHGNWIWGLLLALSCQLVPLTLLMTGVPRTGGRMAGILGSIELPVAVFAAYSILGEHVTIARWAGVLLILIGIVVSEWSIFIGGGGRRARASRDGLPTAQVNRG